jgi:hypothetical protein
MRVPTLRPAPSATLTITAVIDPIEAPDGSDVPFAHFVAELRRKQKARPWQNAPPVRAPHPPSASGTSRLERSGENQCAQPAIAQEQPSPDQRGDIDREEDV